jgi:hypothetical protein
MSEADPRAIPSHPGQFWQWPERPLNNQVTEKTRGSREIRPPQDVGKNTQPLPTRSYEERLADLDKNEAAARVTNNKQALLNIHKAREELKKEFGKGGRSRKTRKTRKSKKARKTRRSRR